MINNAERLFTTKKSHEKTPGSILKELMMLFIKYDQIDKLDKSKLVQHIKNVSILSLKAQWIEFKFKVLAKSFNDLTTKCHAELIQKVEFK